MFFLGLVSCVDPLILLFDVGRAIWILQYFLFFLPQVLALREVIKKQEESIHNLEEENKKLQKSNHELRESARDSGVDLMGNGTAADLNRQMIELTTVIREQVERQFGRRTVMSDGSMEHVDAEDEEDDCDDSDLDVSKAQSQ